jgi:type I restriction enzyme M protein
MTQKTNGQNNGVKTRPVRRLTQAELDAFLEKAADTLRGGIDHSEFRGYVFALLFYKRINDVYLENVAALEKELGDAELARDPRMHDFVVPDDCVWEKVARTTELKLGTALNDAMRAIERANEPKFNGILANSTVDFNAQDRLPRGKLVALINHFSSVPFDRASVPDDVFGNSYEYLVRNFASKAGKQSGEFYTPKEVAFLMSEIVDPQPGHHICDWAAGSASLLLQCRNYVERRYGKKAVDRLFFYMQEVNPSTANIARINMYLHGVRSFNQAPASDSLRAPYFREGQTRRLRQFDRVVMNPPFSLKDWGFSDFAGGDPYDRFSFGMPPGDNGDYAWLQQVVKSLKPTGKAIVVMSQGVLFRDQPEQTLENDGRVERAGTEYVIREGFVKADLIECVIVLPSKIFYGNNVPGCLVVLDKHKPADRKNKILMIWASRHYLDANPQNLLRKSDCMRILVPWRAFGDLAKCRELIPPHEAELIGEIEAERAAGLKDIHDAYDPLLAPLPAMRAELPALEAADFSAWQVAPNDTDPYFGPLKKLLDDIQAIEAGIPSLSKADRAAAKAKLQAAKVVLREQTKQIRDRLKDRLREVKAAVKELSKLEEEANQRIAEINAHADREIAQIKEAAADLARICADPEEAARYFAVADRPEIAENEFNLNVPRYVDTFEPEEQIPLAVALKDFEHAKENAAMCAEKLSLKLGELGQT